MPLDLLLINPYSVNPNPMIPLGVASLAAVSLEAGYSVRVVDGWAEGLSDSPRLIERLRKISEPRVVGVSILTTNVRGAANAVSVARSVFPAAHIVIGGPHVSALPDSVLDEFFAADLGVFGEGENTLVEILDWYKKETGEPRNIPGTIWRGNNGVTKRAAARAAISDLDILPRPARDLFPTNKYHPHPPYGRRFRYMNAITSRGCPFRCAYCSKSVFGNSYRAFSPARVIDDIRDLVEKYNVHEIHFYDDDLTLDRKRTMEIMERLIAARLDLVWSCTTRCDLVDAELLRRMKRAGCWMISYGVESGNDALRAKIDKGVTRERIVAAFRETKRAGIKTTGYFIIGLPGETEETVAETVKFIGELAPAYVNLGVMTVYPGSQFYKDVQTGKYGAGRLVGHSDDAAGKRSPFQDAPLYGFEGTLSRPRMEELCRRTIRRFYLRPGTMVRMAMDIHSWSQFRFTVRTAWRIILWLAAGKPAPANSENDGLRGHGEGCHGRT